MNNTPRTNDNAAAQTSDNVTNKRRATDWQQDEAPKEKPLSVTKPDVFGWHEGDGVAFLGDKALARVTAALSGARSVAAVLLQQHMDRSNEDNQDGGLNLDDVTVCGLFSALSACLDTAETHATGEGPAWTTRMTGHDEDEAEHMRRAARDASITKANRRAVEHVELLNRCKAAKAGRSA